MGVVVVLAWLAGAAWAATVTPLATQERAAHGATHVVTITHADLTESSTNTTQTLTNLLYIAANQSVELVKMELVTAFQDDATNGFASLALEVGDGTDTDLYLDSTELNVYGTEVYAKHGRILWGSSETNTVVTGFTPTVIAINGTNVIMSLTTNTAIAVLGTATGTRQKFYTSADYVDFKFSPTLTYALDVLDQGEVRLYFTILKVAK